MDILSGFGGLYLVARLEYAKGLTQSSCFPRCLQMLVKSCMRGASLVYDKWALTTAALSQGLWSNPSFIPLLRRGFWGKSPYWGSTCHYPPHLRDANHSQLPSAVLTENLLKGALTQSAFSKPLQLSHTRGQRLGFCEYSALSHT